MKIDDLVSLKKKTKLSESEILTEKDYVGGAPQKRYFTFARDPEPESDPRTARQVPDPEHTKPEVRIIPIVTPKITKPTVPKNQKFVPKKIGPIDQKRITSRVVKQPKITGVERPKLTTTRVKPPQIELKPLGPPKLPQLDRLTSPKSKSQLKLTTPKFPKPKIPLFPDLELPTAKKPQLPRAKPQQQRIGSKLSKWPILPDPGEKKKITKTEKEKLKNAGKTSTEEARKKALANAKNNLKLDKKRINTLTGKLEKLLDEPNLKQLQAIRDQIPLVRNKTRRAILKKELLRIQNLHYSTTQHFQTSPIKVGPHTDKPIVKPVEPDAQKVTPAEPIVKPLEKGQVLPKKGEGIKAFAKRLGYPDVESFKNANPDGIGVTKKGQEFVKTGVSYIDHDEVTRLNNIKIAKEPKVTTTTDPFIGQKNELKNAEKLLKDAEGRVLTGTTAKDREQAKKMVARLKNHIAALNSEITGVHIEPPKSTTDLTIGPERQITLRNTNARRIGNILRGGAKFMTSFKGDILTTALIAAATTYGYGKWGRNIAIQQDALELQDRKLRKEFEDNPANEGEVYESNPLYKLTPMQYVGGVGSWVMMKDPKDKVFWNLAQRGGIAKWSGMAGVAEMLSHDETITRTMYESTEENEKDITDSYANMKSKNVTDFPPTTDVENFNKWLEDNVVTLMLPDGTMKRINVWGAGDPGDSAKREAGGGESDRTGAETFKALLQPGTVIQVIPTHRYSGDPQHQVREEIDLKDQTKNMTTSWIDTDTNDWTGEFKSVYHRVSDKEERGGRITVDGKQMYIPTKMELDQFLLTHLEDAIPDDWYKGFRDETEYDRMSDEEKEIYKHVMIKRPTTPEGWVKKHYGGDEIIGRKRIDTYRFSGPDMTDQERITWWKAYRTEHGIDPPHPPDWTDANEGVFGRWWDKILDPIGQFTGLWKTGEWGESTHDREGSNGKFITREEHREIVLRHNPDATFDEIEELVRQRMINSKMTSLPPSLEAKIATSINSWKGKIGAPDTVEEYNKVIDKLAIAHDLDTPEGRNLIKALGMSESGIKITGNTLSKWAPRGDYGHGLAGAFGLFHVRSDPKTTEKGYGKLDHTNGASVEQYNKTMNLEPEEQITWEDITTNPMLAAHIGVWYFKFLLDHNKGDIKRTYMDYTGGQGASKLTTRAKFKLNDKQKKRAEQLKLNGNKFARNFRLASEGTTARPKPSRKIKDNDINP